jgi:hypothetical protein
MGLEAPIGNPLLVVDSFPNSSQAIPPINKVHFRKYRNLFETKDL